MLPNEFFFDIESSICLTQNKIPGIFFYSNCEEIIFSVIKQNEWMVKYKIECILGNNHNVLYNERVSEIIRDRIASVFVILSKSDVIVSDEIFFLNGKTLISRSDYNQIKKRTSVYNIDLNLSKLCNIKSDLIWDFLIRYSKTFISISEQKKMHEMLSTIDLGGKILIYFGQKIKDKVTPRMKAFLVNIGVLEDGLQKKICGLRHEKDHENKYITLPVNCNLERLRSLVYPTAEGIIGINGINLGINLGDKFNII